MFGVFGGGLFGFDHFLNRFECEPAYFGYIIAALCFALYIVG